MSTIGINHINLRAPLDLLIKLRDFYCEALNLQVGKRPNFKLQGFWLYAGDNALIHLAVSTENEKRQINVRNSFDHIAFTCTNLKEMCAKLTAMGVQFHLNESPDSLVRQVFFNDPAGNGVELTFNNGR